MAARTPPKLVITWAVALKIARYDSSSPSATVLLDCDRGRRHKGARAIARGSHSIQNELRFTPLQRSRRQTLFGGLRALRAQARIA